VPLEKETALNGRRQAASNLERSHDAPLGKPLASEQIRDRDEVILPKALAPYGM